MAIYYDMKTKNKSFLDMHKLLKSQGIKNNKFFLQLNDKSLVDVDPYNPDLNTETKQKIIKECIANYWYFIREVLIIPCQGGYDSRMYKLHPGNLAINFCMINNFNTIIELSTQHGKNIAVISRLTWEFLFGTINTESGIMDKVLADSMNNLSRLKELVNSLPQYLKLSSFRTNTRKKYIDNYEKLECPINRNIMNTLISKRYLKTDITKSEPDVPARLWINDFIYIKNIKKLYYKIIPKYVKSSLNALKDIRPYGIILTTTSGDLNYPDQQWSYSLMQLATRFSELWYDLSIDEINNLILRNTMSSFVYIRYTYKEMGTKEIWFNNICRSMNNDTEHIKKEVLLEWIPFKEKLKRTKVIACEKTSVLDNEIFYCKRSYEHPLIGQVLFNETFSYFTVEKVWNMKGRSKYCSSHNYEKDDRVYWTWKVQIRSSRGVYTVPMLQIIKDTTDREGKLIPDDNMFMFYK